MKHSEPANSGVVRPVILVGFVGVAIPGFAPFQPENSVIFIEEPDVIRKRAIEEKVAGAALVRELIPWEFHLPGTADEFYHIHRGLDPAAIIPLSEYSTPFAARLAERYGLPGAGFGAATILRDKALLRQVSRAAGIANPESCRVNSAAEVRAFLRAGTGPIVLKPANRQASVGTQVIHDVNEVEQAWANCIVQDEGVFVPDRPMELRMLVERFVTGAEYSVEMLVQDGMDIFANVTDKRLFPGARPVERSHVVPADIGSELAALLRDQTRQVLDAAGFRNGIVHCEWIVSGGVPYLVECAGRLAGDGIIELIEHAYPVDLKRAYVEVMKGIPVRGPLSGPPRSAMAARFLTLEAGVLAGVTGVRDAASAEGVVSCDVDVAPGDRLAVLRSSWDRVGDLVVSAATPAEALRLAEAAAALIRFDVHPEAEIAAPVAVA